METGETPFLGLSRCFARLILSFALRLANLHEVPLLKCEGDGKGLQALIVCPSSLVSLSFTSVTFPSLYKPLFLHFIDLSTLTVHTCDVQNFHKT